VLHDGRIVAHGTPVDVLTDDNVGRWWGVTVRTESDANGRVSVTVRRRPPTAEAAEPPASSRPQVTADDVTPASGR
jgi:hypothetical protein